MTIAIKNNANIANPENASAVSIVIDCDSGIYASNLATISRIENRPKAAETNDDGK